MLADWCGSKRVNTSSHDVTIDPRHSLDLTIKFLHLHPSSPPTPPEEKVSSFLFSCISFKYVLLLALVSECNCFLRSRCSMEMWCPDDTGPDGWDWVGPPAWERACFNSPEWVEAPRPLKRSLSRLCYCCCCFNKRLTTSACMSTTA